jgi:WD40 repeat protein
MWTMWPSQILILNNALTILNNDNIVSGSWDQSIKIWNFESGLCVKTLNDHTNWVTCLTILNNDKIVNGSWDQSIKIWNFEI